LRVAISEAELKGHAAQEQSWAATDAILTEKFTNEERYEWMIEVLREVHQQAFQQALRLARVARECLVYELPPGTPVASIGQSHWSSPQHGLLAGERLGADLLELNVTGTLVQTHEREVTQNIPLSFVAPAALVSLRRSGSCSFSIPRWWLQRFDPTLTNRRLKTLSVSVPGVAGPYVGMNATLAYQGALRTRSAISLSTGLNDYGVDPASGIDKYLPFEGLNLEAAVTRWTFGFPQDPADATRVVTEVDYSKIADVILHLQYTADAGAPALDGPPELLAFIDVAQMDADSWAALVASTTHQATLPITRLVPGFLSGYHVASIVDSVALLRDGSAITDSLAIAIGAGATPTTITIAAKPATAVTWANLARIYLVVKMTRV